MLFGDLMLVLVAAAIQDGNPRPFAKRSNATTKPSCHPHQMGIVELFLRAIVQPAPPATEATR
jgi:hypothetical protein